MSKNLKIVLVILGVVALSCLVCTGGAFFWIQSSVDGMAQMGEEVTAEAAAFAAGKEDVECVDESLQRALACGDIEVTCRARASVFLTQCANAAAATEGFCAGVPTPASFSEEVAQTVAWSLAECQRRSHADEQRCADHIKTVVKICKTRSGMQ